MAGSPERSIVTDPLPEWFEKIFADRFALAVDRVALAQTTEQLWAAKGSVMAFKDLESEIFIRKSEVSEAERAASERYLTPHA